MHEFVRAAVIEDVDELVRLEQEHRDALASGVRGGAEWLRDHATVGAAGWTHALHDASNHVIVAGLDGAVLGYAHASLRPLPIGTPNAIAQVHSISVADGAREVGLGEALVSELVNWATGRGATAIEAEALPGDRQTKNLFERVGLVARLLVVSKSLP